jgi:protein KIAA0825
MAEALAERLLDLHGRLLSLYVLQGQNDEGGSASVRMWWLYMQGTRQDLWDTVPPKMAQRVFAGMLNETLTILTVRYTQVLELP